MDLAPWHVDAASALESLIVSARSRRQNMLSGVISPPLHPMTECQRFTLKMQIIVFGQLCKRFAEMQGVEDSAQTGFQPPLQGGSNRNNSGKDDAVDAPVTQERPSSSRRRWRPSGNQLQILEMHYKRLKQRNAFLDRNRILAITDELSQHGDITESQVRSWLQNRKRKENSASSSQASKPDALEQFQSDTAAATTRVPATIMFRGHSLEVEPEMYNVRGNFGHNVVLVDSAGDMVPVNALGVTVSRLRPGERYTLHFHFDL